MKGEVDLVLGQLAVSPTSENGIFLKDKKWQMVITATLLCFGRYLPSMVAYPLLSWHYFACGLFTSLSLLFILFYNQKEGPKAKYFFYVFYPLHMIVLYLIGKF